VVASGADGVAVSEVRELRRIASGNVTEEDIRRAKAEDARHLPPVASGPVLTSYEAFHDEESERRAQVVASARARFGTLTPDVGLALEADPASAPAPAPAAGEAAAAPTAPAASPPLPEGVRVLRVTAGGAAATAGIRPGDLIIYVNFKETPTNALFADALASILPGDSVPFQISRDGSRRTVVVQAGASGLTSAQLRDLRRLASGLTNDHDFHHHEQIDIAPPVVLTYQPSSSS